MRVITGARSGRWGQNPLILPTHQVNALLMDPGGYTTRDYLKTGGVMTIVFIAIAVTLMYLIIG